MAKIINVYCEGRKGSHDFDILSKLLGFSPRPVGGKRGANAIIAFREELTEKSDFYLFFRDRDFDCPIPQNEELTFDGKKTYFSYRTTIENYLFDISVFLKFLENKDLQKKYGLHSETDVKRVFIDAANKIKDYQAVRHALGAMRSGKATFDTTWTDKSGILPKNLNVLDCQNEAWKIIEQAKSVANDWTIDILDSEVKRFLTIFDEDFFKQLRFLVYFQGKDFATALTDALPQFPLKDYYKFAKKQIDFSKYADLSELYSIVNAMRHKNIT